MGEQTDVSDDLCIINDGVGQRAVYMRGDTVLHQGLPYVSAAVPEDFEHGMIMQSAHEGTMLHAVYTGTHFILGTNKRLSCENSRWASRHTTFKQSFEAALSRIYPLQEDVYEWFMTTKLNPKFSYVFLVMATEEERLVAPVDTSAAGALLLATCAAPGHFMFNDSEQLLEFPRPHIVTPHSLEEVHAWLTAHPHCSGLLARTADNRTVRFSLPQYTKMLKIRGNVPNIRSRVLELLHRPDDLFQLTAIFPHLYEYALACMSAYQRLIMAIVATVMNYATYCDDMHVDRDFINRVHWALNKRRHVNVDTVHDVCARCFMRLPVARKARLLAITTTPE
ncbi:hypothetical protein IJGMMPBP_00112 [Infectious spleen and kidney necrosis virus]|uniref:ORF115R n=4 Tax=Infectious spleen and kidney necrosis virus TaxID=180170 RepID=Q8QUJ5_ISKNN|nr:ORF115R [Infectious spleen and kidney necrosis virus]QIQ54555.1 FV3 immediate-eary protein ICP46-like protein [Angelfish iridovirus AFIV-16]QOE77250.1 immediate early protein ICP-46 [Banggai cardinalfish iridovirus]QYK20638.1 immediate-early protein ICP-46 [Spotted knifejaw iridovirus]WEP24651.1 ORF112R [Largemouth bass ulcerative syndrome virus]AAL98839.1 ORF115R [Infectious spleen and kidney necrosis virus]